MSKINILYWNIHNCGGVGQKRAYEQSSHDIISVLNNKETYMVEERFDKKTRINAKNLKDIDAIVFTESYPQRNDNQKSNTGNWNMILRNELKEKGFAFYQDNCDYDSQEYWNYNSVAIFVNEKRNHVIEELNLEYKYDNEFPDCKLIYIVNLQIVLGGMRIKNDCRDKDRNKIITGNKQIENLIKKYIDDIQGNTRNRIIILGDFNFGSAYKDQYFINGNEDNERKEKFLNLIHSYSKDNYNINVTNNGGSFRTRKGENERFLQEIWNDAIIDNFNAKVEFYKLYTPEQMYCNEKYIDLYDGHIKKEYLYKPDKSTQILLKEPVASDFYKNNITNIVYGSSTMLTAPYPDHNLLFASIEV